MKQALDRRAAQLAVPTKVGLVGACRTDAIWANGHLHRHDCPASLAGSLTPSKIPAIIAGAPLSPTAHRRTRRQKFGVRPAEDGRSPSPSTSAEQPTHNRPPKNL